MKRNQQELPFNMEEAVGTREDARKITKACDHLRKIHLNYIFIRPGFNARQNRNGISEELYELSLGIPDLADKIYASNGPADPIMGDITKEGRFYQTEGERRIRALRHLIRTDREIYPNGSLVTDVLVLLNPPGTTDLERKRKVLTTNDKLPLKPMDRAYFYLSFKIDDGMTHEEIADNLRVSRQTVDNYIKATELPQSVQDDIDDGKVNISAALSQFRKEHSKLRKTAEVDLDSGEILEPAVPIESKKDGDEDEFLDKQDNSISSAGTLGGPKESGSGAHVVGVDSIYRQQQIQALWRQLVNRYEVIKQEILLGADLENEDLVFWEDRVAERLRNEYNLTVK